MRHALVAPQNVDEVWTLINALREFEKRNGIKLELPVTHPKQGLQDRCARVLSLVATGRPYPDGVIARLRVRIKNTDVRDLLYIGLLLLYALGTIAAIWAFVFKG